MVAKILMALLLSVSLAGCSWSARTGSLCTVGPLIPDPGASERWTRSEKEQLVTLNRSGERMCGWKAPA